MSSFRTIEIAAAKLAMGFQDGGDLAFRLQFGNLTLETPGVICETFAESTALTGKFRLHRTDDRLSASFDQQKVIPFGSEYTIRRRTELTSAGARITVDIQPGPGGRLRHFSLDPVRLTGAFRRLGILPWDGSEIEWRDLSEAEESIHESDQPFLLLTVETADGRRLDLGSGFDLWRQAAGSRLPGSKPVFRISGSTGTIQVDRQVLQFDAEAEVPKRPWRFEYFLSWNTGDTVEESQAAQTVRLAELELPAAGFRLTPKHRHDGYCQVAASSRRRLHDLVRGSDQNLILADIEPGICLDAGHLERPNQQELTHWDLPELFALHSWANRQLAKRDNRSLLIRLANASPLADTASAAALARPLTRLNSPEEQN